MLNFVYKFQIDEVTFVLGSNKRAERERERDSMRQAAAIPWGLGNETPKEFDFEVAVQG